ncbi:MAG: alkaline phosphatase family protein [Planctomycetota bacterium JB042]
MKLSSVPALLAVSLLLAGCGGEEEPQHKVVVLGIDGMDPDVVSRLMAEGKMPNFKALADEGSFSPLGTSIPPESPVAWSNFITGRNPGGHGVFDFLQHEWTEITDAEGNPDWMFTPVDSIAGAEPIGKTITVGDIVVPVTGGDSFNKRKGKPFWVTLEEHGVPATIYKMPANFPPVPSEQRTISGMGTPDLAGGYGKYFVYTDDQFAVDQEEGASGGEVINVSIYEGTHSFTAELKGPPKPTEKADEATAPFRVDIDPVEPLVRIQVGEGEGLTSVVLREGEWSDYVTVDFEVIPYLVVIPGITRFKLQSVRPTFRLFVDSINFDPRAPAADISTPSDWAGELADRYGLFETKGMPENTKALEENVLSDDEFREYSTSLWERRKKMLVDLLGDHRSGLFFYYFSSIDLNSHMMWRCMDAAHPGHAETTNLKNSGFIEWLYQDLDRVLGEARALLAPEDTLIVMSDHGFSPFYRKFSLNTWLERNGYLVLKERKSPDDPDPRTIDFLGGIDWTKTRAFNFGFQTIYLNLKGRDPMGIVDPADADALVDEIVQRLQGEKDPKTGKKVALRVNRSKDIYTGEAMAHAPEIVVGFSREVRNDNDSVEGKVPETLIQDNLDAWSGCHLMAAELVPGVLFSNRELRATDPKLYDLTVMLLKEYGIDKPDDMVGKPLW